MASRATTTRAVAAVRTASPRAARKYDERFSRVMKAAAEVIAEDGYELASIRKIASRADMSIAGLYYYVSSKEELLFSIQRSTFDRLVSDLRARLETKKDASPEERIRVVIENHLDHFLHNLPELKVCARDLESLKGDSYRQVLERRRDYYLITREIIDELTGDRAEGEPDNNVAALALFGMLNWVYMWFNPRRQRDLQALVEQLSNIFINGLKPRRSR